jgi:hypothetical protein
MDGAEAYPVSREELAEVCARHSLSLFALVDVPAVEADISVFSIEVAELLFTED